MSVSALDKLIASTSNHWPTLTPKDRAELAQLRAAAAELQAAHVYLDESYINDPNDPPLELADRCAQLVKTISEQARQIYQAREIMEELSGVSVRQQLPRINAWLAANPAPSAEPQP